MAFQRPSCPTSSAVLSTFWSSLGSPAEADYISSRSLYTPGCRAFYRYPTRWYLAGAPKVKLGLEGKGLV